MTYKPRYPVWKFVQRHRQFSICFLGLFFLHDLKCNVWRMFYGLLVRFTHLFSRFDLFYDLTKDVRCPTFPLRLILGAPSYYVIFKSVLVFKIKGFPSSPLSDDFI